MGTPVKDHDLLIVTCAPRLGWWAECCCGWISNGRRTEDAATRAHEAHAKADLR